MLDISTLNELCAEINNYFDNGDTFSGMITIENGVINEPIPVDEGQYIRIQGSTMNDGAYCFNKGDLTDETFKGRITVMCLPMDFQNLIADISDWKKTNAKQLNSIFQSESFGGYSYILDTAGGRASLKGVFGSRLNRYRKI